MDDNTENFLKVMREFQWPNPPKISFRVYHDDSGHPIKYSMVDICSMADTSDNYIEISEKDYQLASMDSRVINGRLVHPVKNTAIKLRPGDIGTACHPDNVCVVVSSDQPNTKWSIGNGTN